MWVGREFEGDDHEGLKMVQFRAYWALFPRIAVTAWARYSEAEGLLGLRTDMPRPPDRWSIDHRSLQDAHDIIAAAFRYRRPDLLQKTFADAEQLDETVLLDEWRSFLDKEVDEITRNGPICRVILRSVLSEDSRRGMAAEQELRSLLVDWYFHFADEEILFDRLKAKCLK